VLLKLLHLRPEQLCLGLQALAALGRLGLFALHLFAALPDALKLRLGSLSSGNHSLRAP